LIFTEHEISELIRGRTLRRFRHPIDAEQQIETFLRIVVQKICTTTGTMDRTEWNHYGSGYASFIDAWFYHPDGRARRSISGNHHAGIFVLLSRLTATFSLGQGEKAWSAKGGSSYLPNFESIDVLNDPALIETATAIGTALEGFGLMRLRRVDLEPLIPETLGVPTILSDPPHRVFDAVFHWED
jgi:hypothetical protein